MAIDYSGVSLLIPTLVAGFGAAATVVMQVVNWYDARAIKNKQAEMEIAAAGRDVKIDQVKNLVNGASDKLLIKATKEAFEQGRQHEREEGPSAPSPSYPASKVDALITAKQVELGTAPALGPIIPVGNGHS